MALQLTVENPQVARTLPVQIDLDVLGLTGADEFHLVEVTGRERRPVPAQVDAGARRTLHWLVEASTGGSSRRFELAQGAAAVGAPLALRDTGERLTIGTEAQPLLGYQHGTMPPPAGVDPAFARSGFIHPLRAPRGQVLTRVQPPDHYHHYGLWNPWTQVEFGGRTVDFWNLAKREGTVRFAQFASRAAGPVFGQFAAVHEHVVLQPSEQLALLELQTVRVYQPSDDTYLVDLVIQLSCATDQPVRLLEYRYGGLGWRATEAWHRGNSRVLTSEGRSRAEADGSLARWCLVEGEVEGGHAGVVLMSHPANYNHPEPLRIWPEDAEGGRGDLFANFSPTKNRDWRLEPGRTHLLRYRLLVYNGQLDAVRAEQAWRDYAHPVAVVAERVAP